MYDSISARGERGTFSRKTWREVEHVHRLDMPRSHQSADNSATANRSSSRRHRRAN